MIRVLLLLLLFATGVSAETITIATRWKGEPLDYSFGNHPFSWIIRTTVLPGIFYQRSGYAPGGVPYGLALADSMKMEGDFSKWYFRLAATRNFTSGEPLSVDDVAYSIDRCQQMGMLAEVQAVSPMRTASNDSEDWVTITLAKSGANDILDPYFPVKLASCPIVQSDISRLFNRENGRGTAIVGAGEFAVTEFDLRRKQLELSRIYRSRTRAQPVEKLVLRGVGNEKDGLTALRVGTVDMLIFKDFEIKELVRSDDTLRLSECDKKLVAYRKELKFACDPRIDFDTLMYER